ncbi:hypothetical protein MJI46_34575, partial [Salmonella enterica subsp. enterica serovar Cerro]|nr:hypothetical protein [Salmonella enterica subsp. enterica serovar Cerro]
VGVDYLINRDWLIGASVWYMDIDTTANYKMGGVQHHDSVRLEPKDIQTRMPVLKPFIDMVKKYGTPYVGGAFCTDRLKLVPFT